MSSPSLRRLGVGRRLLVTLGLLGVLVLACAGGGMLATDERGPGYRISAVEEFVGAAAIGPAAALADLCAVGRFQY